MAPSLSIPKRFIKRVYVEGLFGQFDHDLSFSEPQPDNANLMILYGENGTGKTTLLWLIYHLLNKEGKRGHRTYLARQQFKTMAVTFTDGLEISADRQNAEKGAFQINVVQGTADPASFVYEVDKDIAVNPAVNDAAAHVSFSAKIPDFHFGFLPHDRSTKIDVEVRRWAKLARQTKAGEAEVVSPIRSSINKAIGTVRQQAIRASNQGQLTVNAIYTELIRQVAHVPLTLPETGIEEGRLKLLGRLQEQARLTQEYSKFGLISDLHVEGLLDTLKTMPPGKFYIVDKMLEPFLRGNEARLEALNVLYIALTTTVESVNSLFLNKQIALHLDQGLNILTLNGGTLLPEQLSSGEQELLILFCEVISALRPETILFVDEPELSLNVSWQRVLLNSLLRCASGSTVQFVIATHSIELLAQFRSNVTRLSNKVLGLPQITPTDDARG
jgi:predicted ATPase